MEELQFSLCGVPPCILLSSLFHLKKVCLYHLQFLEVPTAREQQQRREDWKGRNLGSFWLWLQHLGGRRKRLDSIPVLLLSRRVHGVVWKKGSWDCGLDMCFVTACLHPGDLTRFCCLLTLTQLITVFLECWTHFQGMKCSSWVKPRNWGDEVKCCYLVLRFFFSRAASCI